MLATRASTIPSICMLSCILLALLIAEPQLVRGRASTFWSPTKASGFGVLNKGNAISSMILTSMRGGSTEEGEMPEEEEEDDEIDEDEEEDEDDEIDEDEEEDEDEDEDEDETTEKMPAIASNEPVRLIISTNWGNSVVDQTVELTPARTRDVASLKKSLSKQLPGRPPIIALDLVYEGQILNDDILVDELFDDEEDEDDEDEDDIDEGNEATRKLTLNVLPPVDPKFATELGPKLKPHLEYDQDDYASQQYNEDDLTVDELVDAYVMNQVTMSRNAQLLADPNLASSPYLRIELQEQAMQLREQLQAETPKDVWEKCMAVPELTSGSQEGEWKGQRYRSTKGGVSTQLKTAIQTNMNVDWANAIRHSLLFLFLGYFGGRNSFSRQLLFLCAPLSFGLQARPVKIWFKTFFYMMSHPPLILLSFLPAPQQAILSVDNEAACIALYGEDGAKTILGELSSKQKESTISAVEDEESDVEEDEYDSEEEDDVEDYSDEE